MQPKIAVFASGEGTNFESIVQASRRGFLAAEVAGLIVNRGKIGAVARAERMGIPHAVLSPKKFATSAEWDLALARQLEEWNVEWIALAGFLQLIGAHVLDKFHGRIVNSHPALLPKHGGPGMYGDRVHRAVLTSGDKETGVTIHAVDAVYDHGRTLAQEKVRVIAGDTVETLRERVKTLEQAMYPRVLNDLVTGRITIS